jgi:DNA-binding helix-hairpin-helix protein with protein kinase domain
MSPPELYLAGKPLKLLKRIGKGGEGEVFLIGADAKKAAKIYTGSQNSDREAKVKAMVRAGLAISSHLVSFPEDVVLTRSGEFAGFTMKLVDGYRPVHELYGPKSRKIHYPKADYRFLVRVATNTARAIADVHSRPCIIGDINHSGILVSDEAMVALIDADSFQFQSDGRTYPCLVGVPDFTPPELQGRSLTGVVRTKAHDHFGLAIAIFQLLFMGRHPYAGRQNQSDLTLDQLIAKNLFAYSKARNLPVAPPGVVATLEDLPDSIATAFERAFGLDPNQRPAASEWIGHLQGLEGRLNRCSSNRMHFYPSAAKGCPWCRMEAASGAILFLPSFIAASVGAAHFGSFDVEKAWRAINAIAIPEAHNVTPQLPALPSIPSEQANEANGNNSGKAIGGVIAIIAIGGLFVAPALAILWLIALVGAFLYFNKSGVDPNPWLSRYSEVDRRWEESIGRWRSTLGIEQLRVFKTDLERAVTEYRDLGVAKAAAINRLKTERHSRQLSEFLDRFLIRGASIVGIGPAKTMTLASFGIESAADVNAPAIMAIPGFGRATADKLLAWRAGYERRFVYNPAPLPTDVQAQNRIEAEFAAKASTLEKRISGGQTELVQIAHSLQVRLSAVDSAISEIAVQRAQLEVDLKFLGISMPAQKAATGHAPVTVFPRLAAAQPQRGLAPSAGLKCPQCGSPMVSRVARRGNHPGKHFWGCSRYPRCRGTRN